MGQMVPLLLPALQMQFGPNGGVKSPLNVSRVSELNMSLCEYNFSLLHMKQGKAGRVKGKKKCNQAVQLIQG